MSSYDTSNPSWTANCFAVSTASSLDICSITVRYKQWDKEEQTEPCGNDTSLLYKAEQKIGLSAKAKNYVAYAIMQINFCKYCSMHAIRRYIGLSAEAKNYVAYAIMQTYFCKYCSMHATHRYNLTYDPSFMLLY